MSNNPFKMWGSYVGAVVGGIISMLPAIYSDVEVVPKIVEWIGSFSWYSPSIFGILVLPLGIIIGFLIGWTIHSLFRKIS